MPSCSQLPAWVFYLQALAVPTIAVIGAWIAARQMLIAHDKLQQDAFDKRYDRRLAAYAATLEFLQDVLTKDISEERIRAYALKTADARFLFDEDMAKYIGEVCSRVSVWRHANSAVEHWAAGDQRDEFQRIATENMGWIIRQVDEENGFASRFRSFLLYRDMGRPWFLRWPSQA